MPSTACRRIPERTVEITDWDAVVAELERFCTDGAFHAESDAASCTVGDATIEIHANGRLESGTPFPEFGGTVETLRFDHRRGAITAESEALSYTVRRPCGRSAVRATPRPPDR